MSFLPKQTIVVPVDFSGESENAIRTALEMVDDPANVHLVHVLFPLDSVSPGVVWGDITDDKREQSVRNYFDSFLKDRNISGVTLSVQFGNPGLEVAEYAEKNGADMIVVPSHGYQGVKRVMLGSVAERIIRHASCSVLVLRRSDAE